MTPRLTGFKRPARKAETMTSPQQTSWPRPWLIPVHAVVEATWPDLTAPVAASGLPAGTSRSRGISKRHPIAEMERRCQVWRGQAREDWAAGDAVRGKPVLGRTGSALQESRNEKSSDAVAAGAGCRDGSRGECHCYICQGRQLVTRRGTMYRLSVSVPGSPKEAHALLEGPCAAPKVHGCNLGPRSPAKLNCVPASGRKPRISMK